MLRFSSLSLVLCTAALLACAEPIPAPDDDDRGVGVVVRDDEFDPGQVTVRAGDDVAWVWEGSNPHGVRFTDSPVGSPTQVEGVYARVFATPGTYAYYCPVHGARSGINVSGMSGEVVVNP